MRNRSMKRNLRSHELSLSCRWSHLPGDYLSPRRSIHGALLCTPHGEPATRTRSASSTCNRLQWTIYVIIAQLVWISALLILRQPSMPIPHRQLLVRPRKRLSRVNIPISLDLRRPASHHRLKTQSEVSPATCGTLIGRLSSGRAHYSP